MEERIKNWQNERFEEIINSTNKDWRLIMPRRFGKSYLLRRLAEYYISKEYDVYGISDNLKTFENLQMKELNAFERNFNSKTVILIDGIHKWEPHYEIVEKAKGMIIMAYTINWKLIEQKDRIYRCLEAYEPSTHEERIKNLNNFI